MILHSAFDIPSYDTWYRIEAFIPASSPGAIVHRTAGVTGITLIAPLNGIEFLIVYTQIAEVRMLRNSMAVLVLLFLFAGTVSVAQTESTEAGELEEQAGSLDQTASEAGSEKALQTLSTELGIPVETLKAQQTEIQFGFGNLFIANALAQESGKDFSVLAQQFQDGQGWGAIAGENNLKLGSVVSRIKRSNRAFERQRERERNTAASAERSGPRERANRSHQSNRQQGNAYGRGRK